MRKPDDFHQKRINTTELFRRYSEDEIKEILAADLVSRAAIRSAEKTCKVLFSSSDSTSRGPQTYAEVTITVDHDPPPREALEPSADHSSQPP